MKNEFLREFFAVTFSTLYHVAGGGADELIVEVIKTHGASMSQVGARLNGGTMLSVGNSLITFCPIGKDNNYEREIERVKTEAWGESTSPVVALFNTEEEAQSCFVRDGLLPCDPRWRAETQAVLESIGDDHPCFSVCRMPGIAMACAYEKAW